MNAPRPRIARRPRHGAHITTLFTKRYGFSQEVLADIGLLFLAWSLFENEVETAIWKLTEMPAAEQRPATDRMQSAERLRALHAGIAGRIGPEAQTALAQFSETAEHVLAYRNAIAHGRPFGRSLGSQMSMSNHSFHGELRKRAPEVAHLHPSVLKLALEALETLHLCIYQLGMTRNVDEGIALMLGDPHLATALSAAYEARHIANMSEDVQV